jgi:hypothetical protein
MDEDAKKKIDELIAAGEKLIREAKCKRLDLAKVHNISLNQLIERMCRDVIKDYGKCI